MSRRLQQDVRALRTFLEDRLTDDLARIWARDAAATGSPRPGMAAQVEVVDNLLLTLRGGTLPERRELRILLYGYGAHPDFDPRWQELLLEG